MSWRGKMIGGSIGSFLGPWGTLAGAAVGHVFVDRKQAEAAEKQSLRLLAVTAGALYELSRADGRYTTSEDAAIRTVLGEINQRLGAPLRPHELAYLIDDATRINQCMARLASTVRTTPHLARAAVAWLWRVAVSDGDETPPETAYIETFARDVGLSAEEAHYASLLYRRAASSATDQDRRAACALLGVPYQADPTEIKSAYRTMSQKYHPDKHAGLDPDIRALTSEKFTQIKNAYDVLAGGEVVGDWYAKQADSVRLTPAIPETAVLCFICGQKSRLPARERLASARCPACQALLAFERDLAEHLMR